MYEKKQILLTLLRSGVSHTHKFTAEDIEKEFWWLKGLFEDSPFEGITIKKNPKINEFWKMDNNQNRRELIRDIGCMRRKDMSDHFYFTICNRFANGDKYGMEVAA